VNDYSHQAVITLQPGRSRPDTVMECVIAHCTWRRGCTKWDRRGINRCSVQRPSLRFHAEAAVTAVRLTVISSCSAASLKSRPSTAD